MKISRIGGGKNDLPITNRQRVIRLSLAKHSNRRFLRQLISLVMGIVAGGRRSLRPVVGSRGGGGWRSMVGVRSRPGVGSVMNLRRSRRSIVGVRSRPGVGSVMNLRWMGLVDSVNRWRVRLLRPDMGGVMYLRRGRRRLLVARVVVTVRVVHFFGCFDRESLGDE